VESAISATPVTDRFLKSSTQSCNLHRQTLAVEWPYWRAQWLSALLELPRSTVRAVIVKWKHLGATTPQPLSGRPHKLTEWDRRVLKRITIVCPLLQHSLPSSKRPLEATSSTLTVNRELHEQLHTSLRSPCTMLSFG
jgi:hypothetical protein